ncbi:MAG: murein transglycosylase [Flavobacteriales bacterium TMED123]|nr:MAG: murein transglycosylase [Flavobacteriales bacterium TMED123]|tara:strand:- start:1219 stop:2181 length:963 start_codon:yes stop_codon:yes gene_type:complete
MKQNKVSFLSFLTVLSFFFLIFSYPTKKLPEDKLHEKKFNEKYSIFAINKPENLNFCSEALSIKSDDIWERMDKELLKNIYWQSNTMLYIKRAYKFFPIIEPILKANNIPNDFKYLALIESGLENVVSPSNAAGFWQILPSTARDYGLEVNKSIDERYNLEKATKVACDYLNKAYLKFGSWTMAAASYNKGQNGISRLIENQGTNNYYNLYLNSETSRYVFRIIAVKEILENPKKYGFVYRQKDLYVMPKYKEIQVDTTISNLARFAKKQGINYKILKQLNPWLRTTSMPDKSRRKYILKIPTDPSILVFDDFETPNLEE